MTRIDNDPFALAEQVASWGESPQVVLEATYGWYWAADVLAEAGAPGHLPPPLGGKGFPYRRGGKNERDPAGVAGPRRVGGVPAGAGGRPRAPPARGAGGAPSRPL